jgi:putative sigma-54 modulation protein
LNQFDTLGHRVSPSIIETQEDELLLEGSIMNVNITFRHMDHTNALDSTIREKSETFSKWLGPGVEVSWTCWREGVDHCSEVLVSSGPKEYFAKAQADDLYKTFDLIVHKIHNQLQ